LAIYKDPSNNSSTRGKYRMAQPLRWCVDWHNPNFKVRFLMWLPLFGPDEKAYRDIVRQLSERTEKDLAEWDRFPPQVREMAQLLSASFKAEGIWPSALFLPDDPADIPFGYHLDLTDTWDMFPASICIAEAAVGVKMPAGFWECLENLTYAEVVEKISKKSRTS
jgi:hypothetical protein